MEEFKKKLTDFSEKLEEEQQEWEKMGYNTECIDRLITGIFRYKCPIFYDRIHEGVNKM